MERATGWRTHQRRCGQQPKEQVGALLTVPLLWRQACFTIARLPQASETSSLPQSQSDPEYFCVDTPRDTCPAAGGPDVFRNILDYPPDDCMDRLTTGQATRMAVNWNAYRWVHRQWAAVLQPARGARAWLPALHGSRGANRMQVLTSRFDPLQDTWWAGVCSGRSACPCEREPCAALRHGCCDMGC
jgi:hypothetical protein